MNVLQAELVVLFTGSRGWVDPRPIRTELERIQGEYPGRILVLRHGACPTGRGPLSGDMLAEREARKLGYRIERFPARWHADCDDFCHPHHRTLDRFGRSMCPAAGPRRNQQMVDALPLPTVLVAMVKDASRGASDCVRRARKAGILVRGRGFQPEPPMVLPLDLPGG